MVNWRTSPSSPLSHTHAPVAFLYYIIYLFIFIHTYFPPIISLLSSIFTFFLCKLWCAFSLTTTTINLTQSLPSSIQMLRF
ncbi:hypothetical protein L6452_21039 [Arctium lappa]|uniref:Uncharacterized protein n=1 Tax=Arctium lappa TaxID=4217 RepID=A0ACB9BDX3_ARCLA|nr:hypothetical protein L6452_21039 [Arctium lappa]